VRNHSGASQAQLGLDQSFLPSHSGHEHHVHGHPSEHPGPEQQVGLSLDSFVGDFQSQSFHPPCRHPCELQSGLRQSHQSSEFGAEFPQLVQCPLSHLHRAYSPHGP